MKVKTAAGVFVMKTAGETLIVSGGQIPVHPSRAALLVDSPVFAEGLETGIDVPELSEEEKETVEGLL
jgi:hypothetical protein